MSNFDFAIKRGDTLPPFSCVLLDADDNAVDLSNAQAARLLIRSLTELKVDQPMTIGNQTTDVGRVIYSWAADDTDTAGTFKAEIEVTWEDGKIQTYPTEKQLKVSVQADLG